MIKTRQQICEKLSVCEATVKHLPDFPKPLDSQYFSNLVLYREKEFYEWFKRIIEEQQKDVVYKGDIRKERLIRLKELTELLSASKSHIYKQVKLGNLPKQIKVGLRASGWLRSDINEVLRQNGLSEVA
ncbi:hypothetical protein JCM19233_4772 [Vibrio astriarenae]|nr:hypothetical protein JCM19233_4772 [Vibrio sp. C7]